MSSPRAVHHFVSPETEVNAGLWSLFAGATVFFNIVADFILALFPWIVTWKLKIGIKEKIGLCITMSLGVVVAVISAIRTAWMANPGINAYNDYYFWRQGLSMVWYSAEVAGTIIVQSIPLMRPLVHDMHTSLASRKLVSGAERTNRQSCGLGKSTKRRTLTLILQGCDLKDDENNPGDMQRVDVDRMHLTHDEHGKVVCRRIGDEEQPFDEQESWMVVKRFDEEEMSLTQDQKSGVVMSSECHIDGGLYKMPEYHASGQLEEIPEYNASGRLEEVKEYHAVEDREHIPMTRFHAM
ncbi:hypothetical protein DSL72_008034 [Monilinia vaccinii-corymbosi]|uniref:Rhodopsin domain-containing protein n=1 Tax=Monilinia vaccinii-corymbosi TaxID=61207 RepID=A0A8A3PIK1_9HELO|nr:hypothetical protein DSL72_008034 [Monilinia vaccinii-corymbosi]